MQNDYFKNKPRMSGGILALILAIVLVVGFVSGAGVYHIARNGIEIDAFPNWSLDPEADPYASENPSATLSPHVNPNITKIPEVNPPVISGDDPVVDLYAKLNDTVVTVYNYKGEQLQGTGSGVIFMSDGHLLTNHHVIDGANRVTVRINENDELDAVIVGSDSKTDLAVLKITTPGTYHAAALGDSDKLKVGQSVVAIGSPIGLNGSITQGIVSFLNRAVDDAGVRRRMIQTDCALNPGNSGGPLFNLKGEVVGINSMKEVYTYTGQGEIPVSGLGYAIPINLAKEIALTLISEGKVTRGAIGIMAQSNVVSGKYAGVKVLEVNANGPADKAGIKVGDIIVEIDGVKVNMMEDLYEQLSYKKVGQKISVKVLRNNNELSFSLTLTTLSE